MARPSLSDIMEHSSVAFLILLWLATSYGLIASNKHIMTKAFPYPAFLGLLHVVTSFVLTAVMYLVRPSMFPFLGELENRQKLKSSVFGRGLLPIAVCFCVEVVLGNQAYLYSSVAFLQMLKELNVVLVYAMALLIGLERFSWLHIKVIAGIVITSLGTIRGELHFTCMGFALQMLCCLAASVKITLQSVLLSSVGFRVDALSYILVVMPVCAVTFSFSLLTAQAMAHEAHGVTLLPDCAIIIKNLHVLAPNALLAFLLNVVTACLVKSSSGFTVVLAGILKDAVIVACGVLMAGEVVGTAQMCAFMAQLFMLLVWFAVKNCPESLPQGGAEKRPASGQASLAALTLEAKQLSTPAPDATCFGSEPATKQDYGSANGAAELPR